MSTGNGSRERSPAINDPHGVFILLLIAAAAALFCLLRPQAQPAVNIAPTITPAPAIQPYTASCPWCKRPIAIDPGKPAGRSITAIGEMKPE
jgi:hypothetical protein